MLMSATTAERMAFVKRIEQPMSYAALNYSEGPWVGCTRETSPLTLLGYKGPICVRMTQPGIPEKQACLKATLPAIYTAYQLQDRENHRRSE